MKFMQHWVSGTKQEIEEVHLKYDAYVRVHGELFEDAWVQMTPEQAENTIARKKELGDIIRMEILADDLTMKKKVVKEGKI